MARLPSYVAQLKEPNETARCENGIWYFFRKTSHRKKGHKNPITVMEKVAIAKPSGRVALKAALRPCIGNFHCYEFGYSYAVMQLCPAQWKASLKCDWESILLDLIYKQSPNTYLLKDNGVITLPDNRFVGVQQQRFWSKLPSDINERLQPLKSLQIAYFPDRVVIASPSETHQAILTSLNISLEGCVL